jgi:pantoate--beta-alanine ligase
MSLVQVDTIASLRRHLDPHRRAGRRIGLVPTMGALHAGHGRLIERARQESDAVVVSIFVNPLQFDRQEDLAQYPRTMAEDLETCLSLGTDVVFAPAPAEVYPVEPACTVDIAGLADHLCGRQRPGHFRGVATVVLKLFGMVQPDAVYFGEKDAQQLAIIRRLVADFNVPVTIVSVPTVREPDGLALSSRNAQLDACGRKLAVSLYTALRHLQSAVEHGRSRATEILREAAALIPADEALRLEYLEIVDPDNMQPVEDMTAPVVAAGALWVGRTRLIDNLRCQPPHRP